MMKEAVKKMQLWRWLAIIFATSTGVLFILLATVWIIKSNEEMLDKKMHLHRHAREDSDPGIEIFRELSKEEIELVVNYLNNIPELNLVGPRDAHVGSSFVHSIEMKLPPKDKVLKFLEEEGTTPAREAMVLLFRGDATPPVVEEYVVGPLPNIQYAKVYNTTSRKTSIPFTMRPFSTAEFMAIFKYVVGQAAKRVKEVLLESYQATFYMGCTQQCLRFSMAPITSNLIPEGTRKAWFWFAYDVEFSTLHQVDFQFLVDMTSTNPSNWAFEKVWYHNQIFPSFEDFLEKYEANSINKTRISFPEGDNLNFGTLKFREPLMPGESIAPPRQFEPDGRRYVVRDSHITYLNWDFNFRVSTTGGLQLLNIRFDSERIVYDLGMQEVAVIYSGNNPASRVMNYADGAGLYGTRSRGMLPGVDCPSHAQFVDTYLYASNEGGARTFENAFCVFEHNTNFPLRRHRAYGRSGAFYGGLVAHALVVRTIISVVNYDYAFDYMFYSNGVIETKVSMTGYLGTAFHYPDEDEFGTHLKNHLNAGLHNHLFHFKADIDIKGSRNRYETWNIDTETHPSPWEPNTDHTQAHLHRFLRETERDALYKFNFSTPKYLVFTKAAESNQLPRGYRVIIKSMSKQLIPEGYGFEPSVSWSRYQMAVTKNHRDEERSSSVFTMWDARDPVVNFQQYLDDDENIVDEDLVAWITLGTQHIPCKENLPNTDTVGSQLSFFLVPFNYFEEDPSMRSRDAVRIVPKDQSRPLEGANVQQYDRNEDPTFLNLQTNSTFLFS